jgi:hypothetical protein
METVIKTASVKVMQSYNYCHFEASATIENENGLTTLEIDEARKKCQRLTDKAVGQYKKAKEEAAKRSDGQFRMRNFEAECKSILAKDGQDRTIREVAMLKQYQDENWQAQFEDYYDYDDDEDYNL